MTSHILLLTPNHLVNPVKTIPWTSTETKNGTSQICVSAINERGVRGNNETETTWTSFAQWLLHDNNSSSNNKIGLLYPSIIGLSTSVFLLVAQDREALPQLLNSWSSSTVAKGRTHPACTVLLRLRLLVATEKGSGILCTCTPVRLVHQYHHHLLLHTSHRHTIST